VSAPLPRDGARLRQRRRVGDSAAPSQLGPPKNLAAAPAAATDTWLKCMGLKYVTRKTHPLEMMRDLQVPSRSARAPPPAPRAPLLSASTATTAR
jgi:hypothetical protein